MRLCVPSLLKQTGAALRRFLMSGLVIFVLALQMFAPQTGQAAGGDWIEICSEYGAVQVLVDQDGTPVNESECPDCLTCALCALSGAVAIETSANPVGFDASLWISRWYASETNIPNPAQFWYKNRGPPRAKASHTHTGLRALALVPTKGEVPCS